MIKRVSALAAIVGAGVLAAALAQASMSHAIHAVRQSGKMSLVKSSGGSGPPQKGGYQDYAGTLNGAPGGKGRIVFNQVATSNFNGKTFSTGGKATFVRQGGSYSGTISGTAGAPGIKATVTITKGSGLYKGATGKVTVKGPGAANASAGHSFSVSVTGSIKY